MPSLFSLNISAYDTRHGDWPTRREHIRVVINYADADVVVLQSVAVNPAVDVLNQAEQLARLLPDYHFCHYQSANSLPDGRAEGLGILSKVRPADVYVERLSQRPDHADPKPRMLMHARYEDADRRETFHIINVQLSPVYEQAYDHIRETIAYADNIAEPRLIVGDFGVPASSPLLAFLREAGWQDAWAELHPNEEGCTYEAGNLTVRVDMAWTKGDLTVKKIKVISNEVKDSRMSAHLGVYVRWEQ